MALHDVDAMSQTPAPVRALIKARLLHDAEWHGHALQLIRQLDYESADLNSRIMIAEIAAGGGAAALVRDILVPVLDLLKDVQHFEMALRAFHRVGDSENASLVAASLSSRQPESSALRAYRHATLYDHRDYAGLAALNGGNQTDPEDVKHFEILSRHLQSATQPDYSALISAAKSHSEIDDFRIEIARDAVARSDGATALENLFAIGDTSERADQRDDLMIRALENVLATSRSGEDEEFLTIPVLALLRRVASDTSRSRLRASLAYVLQPAVSADLGQPIILAIIIQLFT
ncbi:MAG: hypothetical protein JWM90_1134, partial [Thermoleophilia bacterium]|nr:hypothetical protein [Thermoleophilia bacterium]